MKLIASAGTLVWLAGIALLALLFLATQPIPQDPAYFHFADQRRILSLPNFWNVVSNLPFLFVGIWGLLVVARLARVDPAFELRKAYRVFFVGVLLTAFGSAYFHAEPGNGSLFWDRLPMTIAFAGLFAAVLGEYISMPAAQRWLLAFLLIGGSSVVYWQWTEWNGAGDLRPYAIVQFLPMLVIPAILVISKRANDIGRYIWLMILFYVIAKLLEHFDADIFERGQIMSGHALKHLAASTAPAMLALGLSRRLPQPKQAAITATRVAR